MFAALSTFKGIAKLTNWSPIIENLIFKLHSRLTVLLLIVFSALVTMDVFFGTPIECFTTHADEFPKNYMNSYCWMHTTYTLANAYDQKVGEIVIAPGVAKAEPGDEKIYHSYYQWVSFFLFFAGVTFFLPHRLWKELEGKRIEKTLLGLNALVAKDEKNSEANVQKLAEHLRRSKGRNTIYALAHAACEMLNLVVVLCQIFLTDTFLGGEFTQYGSEVVTFSRTEFTERTDPMVKLFPRVAKCTLYKTGPSGSIQNHDALCVLTINVANEKIFIFLWFWYLLLATVGGLALTYRLFVMVFGRFRLYVLRCGCHHANPFLLENLVLDYMATYGDWFVLRLMEKNLSTKNFCELAKELDRLMKKDEELLVDRFAQYTPRTMSAYETGNTMPIEIKTKLYGPTKVRISNGKINGNHNFFSRRPVS